MISGRPLPNPPPATTSGGRKLQNPPQIKAWFPLKLNPERKEALMTVVPSVVDGFYSHRQATCAARRALLEAFGGRRGSSIGNVERLEAEATARGPKTSSSHYELSGNVDPSNDEFKQKALEKLALMQHVDSDNYLSDHEVIFQDDFTDIDSSSDAKEILNSDSDEEKLTYFICVSQMAKAADTLLPLGKKLLDEDNHAVHLPNSMIGFGVLTEPDQITQRTLPEDAIEPPYFYHDNMVVASVGVWTKTSQYLYDVEPEFVDSKHFCTAVWKKAIFIICQLRTYFFLFRFQTTL
ncbi:hypothetical protein F3Y22_tig00112503pilonHSYRG00201 [Hibiscus syriacus]|uniref:Uncharacterized protein n=1 Tax=Hibiscus syriacus TaxID=106335 RepID=A0A6A2Y6I4_HIBSY|nr:hypothetical protein F3Y22_tig00112503pilonHSYRG00201 [Hibiscus syriacus]